MIHALRYHPECKSHSCSLAWKGSGCLFNIAAQCASGQKVKCRHRCIIASAEQTFDAGANITSWPLDLLLKLFQGPPANPSTTQALDILTRCRDTCASLSPGVQIALVFASLERIRLSFQHRCTMCIWPKSEVPAPLHQNYAALAMRTMLRGTIVRGALRNTIALRPHR